jgi:beta-RFAP synthase
MPRLVRVAAPSRLHFGLWSLAGAERSYGGVGAMIERPGLYLEIAEAAELAAEGPLAARALAFARRWAEFHRRQPPKCAIRIASAPPEHAGLGTGTQLGLSVAAGLSAWCGLPDQTPLELALSIGRGLRSAVGTHGFVLGGLIVEQGKLEGEPISPLDCRIPLPDAWRFVLVRPHGLAGLAGDDEASAIASLPAIPEATTQSLVDLTRDRLVPAAAMGDFDAFAHSLYRYGHDAGMCFAARQGGAYNGPQLAALVEHIQSLGYEGVGQSSWGPTLFVATRDEQAARNLVDRLENERFGRLEMTISAPCNSGARIEVFGDTGQ